MYCLNDWDHGFHAAFQGFRKTIVSISFMCGRKHQFTSLCLTDNQ